jgi:hypothetical protein
MVDSGRHLHTLERGAGGAKQSFESRILGLGDKWNDDARRRFEKEYVAPACESARRLQTELGAIAELADRAGRELDG